LLCDGGTAAPQTLPLHIVFQHFLHLHPVKSMMLQEPAILCRYHGVLQVGRNLCKRDELVMLLVRTMSPQRLYPAFHLNCRGPRVDPTQQDDSGCAQCVQSDDQREYTN